VTAVELLIGCGNRRDKRMNPRGLALTQTWQQLVTADHDTHCRPDLLIDLELVPWRVRDPAVYTDVLDRDGTLRTDMWDEVHAYEILEHLGRQGDAAAFFATFAEVWRVLKPDGFLCATVPSLRSPWLWGDPGHRRVIAPQSLTFLIQPEYARQVGHTPMSDYRGLYQADFEPVDARDDGETFSFVLRAVKPSRIPRGWGSL
jgi:hypothetical protein